MEITAGMGEAPDISWTAGESRTTPKGRPLDGTYYSTYWSKELETDGFRSVAEFVESHLDRIQPRRAFLDRLLESGGSAAYFIGIFLDANYGESLTWTLSRRLADYRIDLLLDLYPPQGSKVAPEP